MKSRTVENAETDFIRGEWDFNGVIFTTVQRGKSFYFIVRDGKTTTKFGSHATAWKYLYEKAGTHVGKQIR